MGYQRVDDCHQVLVAVSTLPVLSPSLFQLHHIVWIFHHSAPPKGHLEVVAVYVGILIDPEVGECAAHLLGIAERQVEVPQCSLEVRIL